MKLFHWYHVDALRDWAAGDLIVMAEDLDQAVKQVMEDEEASYTLKGEIRTNPTENLRIYEKPETIQIYGSA